MLDNKSIQERIRAFGSRAGLQSDAAICKQCGFENRAILGTIDKLKTAPQLDTLAKFAKGVKCTIEDLIYNRSEADVDLSRLISGLSEYEKAKVAAYIELMVAEKNKEQKKAA